MADPLAPARGIYHGLLISSLLWAGLFSAFEAWAVDPECVGVTAPPPSTGCDMRVPKSYDFRFCSPQETVDGVALVEGDLASCTVTINGVQATQTVTTPGVVMQFPASGQGSATIQAFCTDSTGDAGTIWSSEFCFRGGPRAPAIIP